MTDSAPAEPPIAIDRVERARGQGDDVRLRLSGRWLTGNPPSQSDAPEALLVIQLQGRRHRFPANRAPADAPLLPGTWQAEFMVPSWAVPERPGQAAVWVGTSVIAVGPPGTSAADAAAPAAEPAPAPPSEPASAPPAPPSEPASAPPTPLAEPASAIAAPEPVAAPSRSEALLFSGSSEPLADPGRGGPLANLLLKETVSALHAELERRSGEAAQLRGSLAKAQSELDSRAARQAGLETAHGELRHELEQLMAAVTRQREDFEKRIAAATESLDGAREQAAMATAGRDEAESALRAARDEAEAELRLARERSSALEARMGAHAETERRQAQDAAALREQLAAAHVSRDAAISEAGGLRAELERLGAELTVMREQMSAHGGDLGEAQRLLADARALTEQLRGGDAT
jgi:hypothetical protein